MIELPEEMVSRTVTEKVPVLAIAERQLIECCQLDLIHEMLTVVVMAVLYCLRCFLFFSFF